MVTEDGAAFRQISIVIADDHMVVRCGVRALLAEDRFRVVAEAGTFQQTLAQVHAHRPDLLILDLALGNTWCLNEIPDVLGTSPATSILILTMHNDADYAREALRAGAQGYLRKEAAGEELVTAVRTICSGGIYLDAVLGARMARGKERGAGGLSARERSVLTLIAAGYTNRQVAAELHLSLRTVEAQRASIKIKLGLGTRAELSFYARTHHLVATKT